MGTVETILGEIFTLFASVGVFAYLVGIKIKCQACGARFYYHRSMCPDCGQAYGEKLDKENNPDPDDGPDDS